MISGVSDICTYPECRPQKSRFQSTRHNTRSTKQILRPTQQTPHKAPPWIYHISINLISSVKLHIQDSSIHFNGNRTSASQPCARPLRVLSGKGTPRVHDTPTPTPRSRSSMGIRPELLLPRLFLSDWKLDRRTTRQKRDAQHGLHGQQRQSRVQP